MEKTMGNEAEKGKEMKRWRDGKTWELKRGRSRVRDIPGDEREGSSSEKMHCGWLPPEVEHFVAAWGRVLFWVFLPICVCQSFQSRLGLLFQGLLRVFFSFLIFVLGHISSHKAYAFFLECKKSDQNAPKSRLTGKGVRFSGVAFYFLRLKPFWALPCLEARSRNAFKNFAHQAWAYHLRLMALKDLLICGKKSALTFSLATTHVKGLNLQIKLASRYELFSVDAIRVVSSNSQETQASLDHMVSSHSYKRKHNEVPSKYSKIEVINLIKFN